MTSDQAEAGSGGPQNVLEEILAGVREDVAARQERVPLEQVREAAASAGGVLSHLSAAVELGLAVLCPPDAVHVTVPRAALRRRRSATHGNRSSTQ